MTWAPASGGLSGRLAGSLPAARTEAIVALLRAATALVGAASLVLTAGNATHRETNVAVAVNLALAGVSLAAALPLMHLRTDRSAHRAACISVALDLLVYAGYAAAFSTEPGAGTVYGVYVLLIGPVRWGWHGAFVTGLPVGLVAMIWPQRDLTGASHGEAQVWLLIALFTAPTAAIATLSRRSSARLRQAQEQFRAAFVHAAIGMVLLDETFAVLEVNRSFAQLAGQPEGQLVGLGFDACFAAADRPRLRGALAELSASRPATRLDVRIERPDGGLGWGQLAASWLAGGGGVAPRVVVQVEDITERKEAEGRLSYLASHDGLTGLGNRALFLARLNDAVGRGDRAGLLFLDVDRFKNVNDGWGHPVGDALLVALADRLREALRPGDVVARIGGDEFVMLCHQVGGEDELVAVGARILAAIKPVLHLPGALDVVVAVSVGAALAGPGDTAEGLLRDADSAMYAAKVAGGGRVHLFTPALRHDALRSHELETDLRRAVPDNQLQLVYQPVVDLTTGRVTDLEALARWQHPTRGSIDPTEFVRLAEQSDLIVELGTWVLRRALRDAAGWQPGYGQPTTVAVNVSPRQLTMPGFAEHVRDLLLETGTEGRRLCLELTETALVGDVTPVVAALRALRELDVGLAIDDFGTGHASLSYLTQFPVDTVKVDQSFVAGVATDAGSAAIVGGVVAMAHAFGRRVVAEGAETAEQLAALRRLGCDAAQGFVLARPMAGDAVAGVLAAAASVERLVPPPRQERGELRSGLEEARRYQLLLDGAREISACLDLEAVLAQSFRALRTVVTFTGGSIQLVEGEVIRLAATDPPAPAEDRTASIPLGKGVAGSIVATGEPRYLPDITIAASVSAKRATSAGVRSYYGVPLVAAGRVIGLLQVDSTRMDAFDDQDRLLILSFASVVAAAVQTAQRFATELSPLPSERPG